MNSVHKSFLVLFIVGLIVGVGAFAWYRIGDVQKAEQVLAVPPPPDRELPPPQDAPIPGVDTRILLYANGRDPQDPATYVGTTADIITVLDALSNTVVATIPTAITPDARGAENKYYLVGDKIYFYHQGDRMVESLDFGGTVTKLEFTKHPEGRVYNNFVVSKDGQKIAWARAARSGTSLRSAVWVADINGSNQKLLLDNDLGQETYYALLRFTQDNTGLFFSEEKGGRGGYILFGGPNNLSIIRLADAAESRIPLPDNTLFVSDISSDDAKVAAVAEINNGENGVIILDIPSGKTIDLPFKPDLGFGIGGAARFSPQGAHIGYTIAQGNPVAESFRVIVAKTAGQIQAELADSEKLLRFEQWLTEGSFLVSDDKRYNRKYKAMVGQQELVPLGPK